MKMTNVFASGAILLVSIAGISSVSAEEGAEPGWSGDAGLGMVVTTGNTDTETVNAKTALIYRAVSWKHTGKLDLLRGSDNDEINADRLTVSAKSERNLSEASYIFGLVNYEDDRFSGFDYRASESLGYGRRLLQTDKLTLNAEGGLGARQSKASDTDESQSDGIVRLAGLFEWVISGSARFSEELDSESGGGLTVTRSVTTLSTQIAGNLAAKFGIRITRSSDAPPGIDNTDTETSTTLVYEF